MGRIHFWMPVCFVNC